MIDVFVFENGDGRRQIAIHSGYGAVWPIRAAEELHQALALAILRAHDPTPLPPPVPKEPAQHFRPPTLEELL